MNSGGRGVPPDEEFPMFTKGQQVKLIQAWDHYGTTYVRDCVVQACGKKRMVLMDRHNGECVGRNFIPAEKQRSETMVVIVATMEEANERALAISSEIIAHRNSYLPARIDATAYGQAMAKELERTLTVPAVVTPYEPGHQFGPK
jgi:hypothetical protein